MPKMKKTSEKNKFLENEQSTLTMSRKMKKKGCQKRRNNNLAKDAESVADSVPIFDDERKKRQKARDENYKLMKKNVEEIVAEQTRQEIAKKEIAEAKAKLDNMKTQFKEETKKFFPEALLAPNQKCKATQVCLDCFHLTSETIEEYFYENLERLNGIFQGRIYSIDHQRYHDPKDQDKDNNLSLNSLCGSIYNLKFTEDQKGQMIDLMDKEIKPYTPKYFIQVLLPDLCLRIFARAHGMTIEEARQYHIRRSVDCISEEC